MSGQVIHFSSKQEKAAIALAERLVHECREAMFQPRPWVAIGLREYLLNTLSLMLVMVLESLGDEYEKNPKHPGAQFARMVAVLVADLEDTNQEISCTALNGLNPHDRALLRRGLQAVLNDCDNDDDFAAAELLHKKLAEEAQP